ncbi:queuine tRNA-ribosyltransferase [Legionella busanensis]|uniref:Queuine tRNA-ribosyltransferase n=1 Tax=Legionella busanensis TaxID=190655 RepID=A0A378JKW9_9GAMM|nr:hypothetical protein [Legionella busanensis]STX51885.1 queuine tRNA-ribosyltransferase [Legionella busanensis]
MQENAVSHYIPLLSSQAGSCLTFANWQNAGAKIVAYQLDELLVKPGLPVLQKLTHLQDYLAWSGDLVLNALLKPVNAKGVYEIRSSYDGQLVQISVLELSSLIKTLKPNKVLLPLGSAPYFKQFWQPLLAEIELYLHFEEAKDDITTTGYYYSFTEQPFDYLYKNLPKFNKLYLIGAFQLHEMQLLLQNNYSVQSNLPAEDGMQGVFYDEKEKFNILEQTFEQDYQTLKHNCQCETCNRQLTRAYLHHLLQHTPLLAQRYLIQHNVYYCQNYLINQN